MSIRLRIDQSAVASEVIDGEAIIMQLKTGLYFSSRGHGAAVWALLLDGANSEQIVAAAVRSCGTPSEVVAPAVEAFIVAAQHHGLGELLEGGDPVDAPLTYHASGPWSAPEFEVFSDMQDLLLLDPVHDVSTEMGWPKQKPL